MTAPDPVDILLWVNEIQILLSRWNGFSFRLVVRHAKQKEYLLGWN